jgi:hypothetical protein
MLSGADLLDEYCDYEFGHSDWKMDFDANGNCIVTFFFEARPEYLADLEQEEDEGDDDE